MSRIEPGPPAPFTRIDSREKCAALAARFEGQKVVGLWGTALPRQNVDVLLELERQLRAAGIATLMLVKANAADLVRSMAPELEAVAILDDKKLFAHLPFISLLVTNDYAVEYSRIEGFRGELLLLPHTVFLKPLSEVNYFADYILTNNTNIFPFDYSLIPNAKIQHNSYLTVIHAGNPKLELLAIARSRNKQENILSFFPSDLQQTCGNDAKIQRTLHEWTLFIGGFLQRWPGWKFVFSPWIRDRKRDSIQKFIETWAGNERFIFSEQDDNKYWLSRSSFMMTDQSHICASWSYASLRPTLFITCEKEELNSFGYVSYDAQSALENFESMQKDLWKWKVRLLKLRNKEMPYYGKSFSILCDFIKTIINTNGKHQSINITTTIIDKHPYDDISIKNTVAAYRKRKNNDEYLLKIPSNIIFYYSLNTHKQSNALAIIGLDDILSYISRKQRYSPLYILFLSHFLVVACRRIEQNILWKICLYRLKKYLRLCLEKETRYTLYALIIICCHKNAKESQHEVLKKFLQPQDINLDDLDLLFKNCMADRDNTGIFSQHSFDEIKSWFQGQAQATRA